MSTISALGARLPSFLLPNSLQTDGKNSKATAAQNQSQQTTTTGSDALTSLSSGGLDLQKRMASVGNQTIDLAQNLMDSFTQKLFGDSAKGATISFDSASLETESSYGVAVQHSEGPDGTTDSAAFQLTDSSHFLGKGTITTSDGRKFEFEVEIQYSDELDVGVSQSQSAGQGQPPTAPADGSQPASGSGATSGSGPTSGGGTAGTGSTAGAGTTGNSATPVSNGTAGGDNTSPSNTNLPTVTFPNIDFPGTLSDLFKLIGHDLQASLAKPNLSGDKQQSDNNIDRNTLRSLSLRLLSLVDKKDNDTYGPPSAAQLAASAYGAQNGQAGDASQPAANDAGSASASDAAATGATTAGATATASASASASASSATPAAANSDATAAAPAASDASTTSDQNSANTTSAAA